MSATDVSERPESENTDETLKATSERHARGTYASDARLENSQPGLPFSEQWQWFPILPYS